MQDTTIALPDGTRHTLSIAGGLQLTVFAGGLQSPRFMALGPRGDIFVGSMGGTLSVILTRRGGTHAERVVTLLSGLDIPHSVAYHNGQLYLGEQHQVSVMQYDPDRVRATGRRIIVPNLPSGTGHITRTVSFGPDGMLYVSIGSSCNVCVESDPRRATIMRYHPDGTNGQIYARGLRNAVGLAWQPGTGLLWATVNGRDNLGDNIPPDEVTIIHQGGNYGWPYCYGNRHPDPNVPPLSSGYCAGTIPPTVALQAHSAPLGIAFSTGTFLPARFRGGIFVAFHGSWNRSRPTGYKLVYIPINGTRPGPQQDVITGWLPPGATNGGDAWGRPVGLLFAPDGSLLISDDHAGVIYRLAPTSA